MTTRSAALELVLAFLDRALGIPGFPDDSRAWNGLQVEAPGPVRHLVAAVDASERTVEKAVAAKADLLLVHHGALWDATRPITLRTYRRLAPLIKHDIALYAAHLPLDGHPEFGNAAVLIRELGLTPRAPFGWYEGAAIGFETRTDEDREAFRARVSKVVRGPVLLIPGGTARVTRVGVVTGGGGGFIRAAAEAGVDTLLTGEGPHHSYFDATELGVNVLYAGHYATEVWGVRALAERVAGEFGLTWEFLDLPTGL